MPKAPIDEDNQLQTPPHNISARAEIRFKANVHTKPNTASVQALPNQNLYLGISALLPTHPDAYRIRRRGRPVRTNHHQETVNR